MVVVLITMYESHSHICKGISTTIPIPIPIPLSGVMQLDKHIFRAIGQTYSGSVNILRLGQLDLMDFLRCFLTV